MDPKWTIPNIVMIGVWKYMGYNVVIFLAGLQNVPQDIYEAAEVRWSYILAEILESDVTLNLAYHVFLSPLSLL